MSLRVWFIEFRASGWQKGLKALFEFQCHDKKVSSIRVLPTLSVDCAATSMLIVSSSVISAQKPTWNLPVIYTCPENIVVLQQPPPQSKSYIEGS